ncbi:hypothetical protein VPH35_070737 [Triticum aestivum]|uniref:Uncharacterized protein n=1 Tax=Triticum aestivum TaxID=4565 RepID=A0A3B6U309_WHEAT|nr:disease resistance protein RGA5-like [Triticum aestivum]
MAMSMATGAMGSLLPKLVKLLKEEYKLKESVKEGVRSLEEEMKSMQAALRMVGEVPRDQLNEHVKIWAAEVRELSFKMEDIVDKFFVRVDDGSEPAASPKKLKRLTKKMVGLFTKGKARHEISDAIKSINKKVQEVADRRARYNVDNIVARPAAVTPIDPRLGALYKEVTDLVGITGTRDKEIIKLLSEGDDVSKKKLKIISVVGFGGLGKTTLVKTVYDKIKGDFECRAFVPVGRNANAKEVFMDILHELDPQKDKGQLTMLNERQLIDKIQLRLENKRYLVVIDDIWDGNLWTVINWAFSNNNTLGSRLITTTRKVDVAELCCTSPNGSVYQMKPLSADDSKRLFYRRLFSHESGCPLEFEEVSMDILKKCGGVPLAIITIASSLSSGQQVKPKDEWHVLLESIGRGLTEDPSVEEMLRILSFSYYDLPAYLKTCLLYLSMFPEDHKIMKNQLIWMWIAEGFIQCETTQSSLFEIGENYFNELVNRSLLQPVYVNNMSGHVHACRVHDSVLDLICLLAREENFVSVSNGSISSQGNVRRLSLQKIIKEEHETTPLESVSMLQVRSIATFEPAMGLMYHLSSFVVLRVLNLSTCQLYDHNLWGLWSLVHLRYLGLSDTQLWELPEEVGKLRYLQVLDLSGNLSMKQLPSSITKLRRLMCLLYVKTCNRFPDEIGNLTSMEELSCIHVDSLNIVKEMGNLKRLRKFEVEFEHLSLELQEAFLKSLGEMSNVQSVTITIDGRYKMMDLFGEKWVPPRGLRELKSCFGREFRFSRMPAWIRENPSQLAQLSHLFIAVKEVQQVDLRLLGRLPALVSLFLKSLRHGPLLIDADGFRCLTEFTLWSSSPGQVMFQSGALPMVDLIIFRTGLPVVGDWVDMGIENLQSLRLVNVEICISPMECDYEAAHKVYSVLENALPAHPNSPKYVVRITVNDSDENESKGGDDDEWE